MQVKTHLALLVAVLQLASAAPQPLSFKLPWSSSSKATTPSTTTPKTTPSTTTERPPPAPAPNSVPGATTPGSVPGATTPGSVPGATTPGSVPSTTTPKSPPPVSAPPKSSTTGPHCKRSWLGKRGCGDDGTPADPGPVKGSPAKAAGERHKRPPPSTNPSTEAPAQKASKPDDPPPGSPFPADKPQPGTPEYINAQIDKLPEVPKNPNIPNNQGPQAKLNPQTHQWQGPVMYKVPKDKDGNTQNALQHHEIGKNHAQSIYDDPNRKELGSDPPKGAGTTFFATKNHPNCKGMVCSGTNVRSKGDGVPPKQDEHIKAQQQGIPDEPEKEHAQKMNEEQGPHTEGHLVQATEHYLGLPPDHKWEPGSMTSSHYVGKDKGPTPQAACKGNSHDCKDQMHHKGIHDIYTGTPDPKTQHDNPGDPSKQVQISNPPNLPPLNLNMRRDLAVRKVILRRALNNFLAQENAKRDMLERRGLYAVDAEEMYGAVYPRLMAGVGGVEAAFSQLNAVVSGKKSPASIHL